MPMVLLLSARAALALEAAGYQLVWSTMSGQSGTSLLNTQRQFWTAYDKEGGAAGL
jgi:hypothetical protein